MALNILSKTYHNRKNLSSNAEIQSFLLDKYNHTLNVLENTKIVITKSQEFFFTEEIKDFMLIISILHDIGRFYQFENNILISGDNFDHGKIGYEKLIEMGIDDIIILLAIKYHNKLDMKHFYKELNTYGFTKEYNENCIYLLKILRDVDKMTNLLCIGRFKERFLEKNFIFTKEVLEDFYRLKVVDYKKLQTNGDRFILFLSWLFDINFKITKDIIRESGQIKSIYFSLRKYGISNKDFNAVGKVLINIDNGFYIK